MITIPTNYTLVWSYKNDPKYQFTKEGICINIQTGRIIRKVLVGGCKGFCLNGKFKSLKSLRFELVRKEKLPF